MNTLVISGLFFLMQLLMNDPFYIPPGSGESRLEPPQWYTEHIEFMTAGGGAWIADNSNYLSDSETDEAYVTRWEKDIHAHTMAGELIGLRNQVPTTHYWNFRMSWDPVKEKAYVYQFGMNGAVGKGELSRQGNDCVQMIQEFSYPDRSSMEIKHLTCEKEKGYTTQSYYKDAQGVWIKNRFYSWNLYSG